eukprot:2510794-Amphidinium_carterae.1
MADRKGRERVWMKQRAERLQEEKFVPVRAPPIPEGAPSKEEVQRHVDAQHLPLAKWCPECSAARSVSESHFSMDPLRAKPARFEMDYNFYTEKIEHAENEKGSWATTLTVVDKASQSVLHIAVLNNGPT